MYYAFCRGADIECVDKDNYTPLLLAASEGHTHVVQLLLEKGANLKKKDTQEKTAIFVAAEENCVDTLKVCSLKHFFALVNFHNKDRAFSPRALLSAFKMAPLAQ